MNERERAEFEHHKKIAEEQLNQMYSGTNRRTQNKGGLNMPTFLAPPKRQPQNTSAVNNISLNSNETKNQKPSQKNKQATIANTEAPKKSSILNLLNFKGLKMDNDRLIILAVCLLLTGEEADELLILALMYIML